MNPAQRIADNLARVQEDVSRAAEQSGRGPDDVLLLPVTKYVSTELASVLVGCGLTTLAESRPQQLWEKAAAIPDAQWHLVGHLQTNKIRRTLPLTELTHSADSERLLRAIDKEAAAASRIARVLLEINTSGEVEKHGFPLDAIPDLGQLQAELPHVRVEGLMTMAPRGGGATASRSFATLRQLRDRLQADAPDVDLAQLSMGMSGDYREAIAEGATIVRIGSALFEGVSPSDA